MGDWLLALEAVPVRHFLFRAESSQLVVGEMTAANVAPNLFRPFRPADGNEVQVETLNMLGQGRRPTLTADRTIDEPFVESFITAFPSP
jgi:hypothetical protein